jgi:hypothetical protein
MVGRVLYWCDETLQQPFETGIQRVVRLCRSGSVGPDIAVVPFAAQLGRTHRHTRKRLTRSAFEPL